MKRLILSLLAVASPAAAEQPTIPETLILPTPLVDGILDYLNRQPRGAVERLALYIEGCVRAQIPETQGAIGSHGECPAVTAVMQARGHAVDPKKKADDAERRMGDLNTSDPGK